MKIRTDFVTNSSSSSFIIAFRNFNELEITEEMLNRYPSLKFYQDFLSKALGTKISGMEDFQAYLEKYYDLDRNDYETDDDYEDAVVDNCPEFSDALKYIEQGYVVFLRNVTCDSGEDEMSDFLYSLHSAPDIIVEDSGY